MYVGSVALHNPVSIVQRVLCRTHRKPKKSIPNGKIVLPTLCMIPFLSSVIPTSFLSPYLRYGVLVSKEKEKELRQTYPMTAPLRRQIISSAWDRCVGYCVPGVWESVSRQRAEVESPNLCSPRPSLE